MKRYNRIEKSLIPDIIPALEKAHEKWIEGASQSEAEYRGWWAWVGSSTCALCKYMFDTEDRCSLSDNPKCSIQRRGIDDVGGDCAVEWEACRDAVVSSDYPEYQKQSALLRDRIGELLKQARGMAA